MKKPRISKIPLTGPQGALEAVLSVPDKTSDYVAIVCHPHPLYGGTMDNKVVHYTARALLEMGAPVLRFNFRGVGQSAGKFAEAVGEIEDCLAAVSWMRTNYSQSKLILAGFSFGAYIAIQAATRSEVSALISIAPAVNLYDFSTIKSVNCPWLLVQGEADEVVPPEIVRSWIEETDQLSKVVWMPDASHFFHGRLVELAGHLRQWLAEVL